MKENFKTFAENIRLTPNQEEDAKTKYDGVCKKLHKSYYDNEYDGSTKFIFGSYKTKTNVRPITENQDVDVIFKIPYETYKKFKDYESNGSSALLQEIRKLLIDRYPNTEEIKAWGKVVLVKFAEGVHNIEVLPAYEKEDGTFIIPNTEDGGSWDSFDPKNQIKTFQNSNTKTNGLTADLARMIKTWVDNTSTLNYKSYQLLCDTIEFLDKNYETGANYSEYSKVVKSYFEYLKKHCSSEIKSHVDTAYDRASKANEYELKQMPKEASEEWRKIFGCNGKSEFPLTKENPDNASVVRQFSNATSPYACF